MIFARRPIMDRIVAMKVCNSLKSSRSLAVIQREPLNPSSRGMFDTSCVLISMLKRV